MRLTKEQTRTLVLMRRAFKDWLREESYSSKNIDFAETCIALVLVQKRYYEELLEVKAYIKWLDLFEDPQLDIGGWI